MGDSESNVRQPASAISNLVTRYVMGEIRETHWTRFMDVLDSRTLAGPDREAFAAFFSDCLDEVGDGDVFLPILVEASEVADATFRAAA
jgi:hypothetical protein